MNAEGEADDGSAVRARLDLGYDGGGFHGWARQPGRRTVQGELEAALTVLFARQAPAPGVTVAGRTDVGVHATGQVAHVDLSEAQLRRLASARGGRLDRAAAIVSLARRLNGIAGRKGDVRVHRSAEAPPGFDARFGALWRRYEYRIADRIESQDPRSRGMTLWRPQELDLDAMQEAADGLLGLHDFASFCRPRPEATTIRTLQSFSWTREPDGVLVARLQADAFCHSMVRALVGACVAVGEGRLAPRRVAGLRDEARRTSEFAVLPAHGLTLVEVGYPPDEELAARAERTRARRALDD